MACIRRLVKAGATGKTIAAEIGRSIFALYQKASMEGISLSKARTVRRSAARRKPSWFLKVPYFPGSCSRAITGVCPPSTS